MSRDTVEIPVQGMDCAECAAHVQGALSDTEGVQDARVSLMAERADVTFDPEITSLERLQAAIRRAGYEPTLSDDGETTAAALPAGVDLSELGRAAATVFAAVVAVVILVAVVGEGLGLLDAAVERVPAPVAVAAVLLGGYSLFRNVVRALLDRRVTSHALMSLGVLGALLIGEYATAAVLVFFMRVGDYVEGFTTEQVRKAVRDLAELAPQTACVLRDGREEEVPVDAVMRGDTVVVRPGEKIPVDGKVVDGQATVDQASITGESMPVEAQAGDQVYAATIARLGSLRIETERVGRDSTFGRVVRMVEEAEANKAPVQRFADRFTAYYTPVVAGAALATYLLRGDPVAAVAVLVVACSCSIALATPVAVLASVGRAAREGLLIKGGKYLEALSRADVVLLDKTGTLTLGKPHVTDVISLNGLSQEKLLNLAGRAERYSEHPLAEAVRKAAHHASAPLEEPETFEALPGAGVRAEWDGQHITVGNRRLAEQDAALTAAAVQQARALEDEGKTVLYLVQNGELAGLLAAADTLRSEVPDALSQLRPMGVVKIELLTGDNQRVAAATAEKLGIDYRAELLPEDKIEHVVELQRRGHTVVMIGDGVNDAPALAQADVGIAMGAAGTDVAVEAADVALMRDDWTLVPEVFRVAQRTMGVVRGNLGFTALYNVGGILLASLGFLPPILAAAAQSLPDLGVLVNSSRLLRR